MLTVRKRWTALVLLFAVLTNSNVAAQNPGVEPAAPDAAAGTTFVPATSQMLRGIPLLPRWDHGLRFMTEDKQFDVHVGGNLQWDSVWLIGPQGVLGAPSSNSTSTINSSASLLRRGRFKADGTIYEMFDYSIEFDLANAANENKGLQNPTQDNVNANPFPANVWMQMRDVPFLGQLRIGNQVKPFGMSNNTYQGFLPFLERADNMDGFYGPFDEGFDPGISAANWTESERIAWRYGIFRPLKNALGIGLNDYSVTGRITSLLYYEDEGKRLIHFGISGSQGSLVADEFRLRVRPLLRNGPGFAIPILADTGTLPASNQFTIAPECAAVYGPWTFQAEWTGQFIQDAYNSNGQSQGTPLFHGGYAQVLYFLTGEHQEYEKREGVFGRVIPRNNVRFASGGGCQGIGAWQVGLRMSYIDLSDNSIDGGRVVDWTVGLNWFLNPNMKIQANYLLTLREGPQGAGDGWFNGLGLRVACDF
ncbi:MAG: porin [Gemmatales bacterium]